MTAQPQTERKVIRSMTIEEVLSLFPTKAQKLAQELTNSGLHCTSCSAATWETLEGGAKGHGMSDRQIDELVERLNALLEEPEADPDGITLTPRAARKYLSILQEEGKQGWGLRLDERMAGCSGYEYSLDYSEAATADDTSFESQGIQIHIRTAVVKHMKGCEVDYVDGLRGSGFKISNPNVRSACGCGSSHGY